MPLTRQRPEKRVTAPDPAVLLVGADEKFLPAIEKALARHRVFVETTDLATVVDTVVAAAPDLVMLMGDAANDCGNEVLRKLAESPQSAVVPVVILDDDTVLDARLRAFRHGAAAVIPRSASVDAIADQVAKLAREIPERHGSALGEVGDTTLQEFVETLSKQLRSGILSVSAGEGSDAEAVRLVLGQGRPLADLIDDFVKRARKHVLAAEPLRYEFDEHVSGTVQVLGAAKPDQPADTGDLSDVRIALADSDAARADNIAQELRSLGATVIVTDLNPSEVRFARMRQVDPTILLIGEAHVQGEGYDLVRRMRNDTRLRWASLLVVRWEELWAETDAAPKAAVQRLAGTLAALSEPENSIRQRAQEVHGFDTRLEITGPARCLRALTAAGSSIRVTVNNGRLSVQVDLANKLVVGATATRLEPVEHFEGATALSAFLQLSSGRVSVEPVQNPATANMMTTVDVALNMADAEPPPIAPSMPAGAPEMAPASVRPAPVVPLTNLEPPETGMALPPSAASPMSNAGGNASNLGLAEPLAPAAAAQGAVAAPSQRGISPMTAALLVGLAIMQGLLVVVLWRVFTNDEGSAAAKPPEAAKGAQAAQARPENAAQPEAAKARAAATATASARSPAPERSPVAAASASTAVDLPTLDGSGNAAPTCDELWADKPPRQGQYPGAAYAQARDANKWITRGDVDRAQHAYCLAVRWDRDNVGYLVSMAHLLLLRRDGKQAVPLLERALELDAGNTRAKGLLGDALARIGEYERAKEQWLVAAGHAAGQTDALASLAKRDLRRGQQHLKRHEWVHAERMLRRAIVMSPKSIEAAVGLSRSLTAQQDPKPAMIWAKYAVALDPRNAQARIELGDALAKMGDREGAKIEWQEAQLLDPSEQAARQRLSAQ